jgi:hypothetical protein
LIVDHLGCVRARAAVALVCELSALVVGLASELERAHVRIAELEARLGRASRNSSSPPSADSIAVKAKRRADRSSRERSPDRKPGGQPGRKGSGLAPSVTPDRTETLPAPGECSGCGADLADAADAGMSWAQVWDIPLITLQKVHYLLGRRRCGCCGKITTAVPPLGTAGNVTYGPNVNAAAILLASEGNVPIEKTAHLMAVLLGAPVSTGFVARALERFAQRLGAAGFDEAMKTALRAEEVLCGEETPTNVISKNTDAHDEPVGGSPHAVTVRTPDARLVYYAPIGSRSKTAHRYDHAVAWGITTNRHRDWATGNHPGYTLATCLRDKAEQIFTFTRNLAVPWTNNTSEQAPQRPQTTSNRLRLLAHTHHPRRLLPRPLLPHQHPRPRHPRRPHRQPLAPHTRNGLTSQPNP